MHVCAPTLRGRCGQSTSAAALGDRGCAIRQLNYHNATVHHQRSAYVALLSTRSCERVALNQAWHKLYESAPAAHSLFSPPEWRARALPCRALLCVRSLQGTRSQAASQTTCPSGHISISSSRHGGPRAQGAPSGEPCCGRGAGRMHAPMHPRSACLLRSYIDLHAQRQRGRCGTTCNSHAQQPSEAAAHSVGDAALQHATLMHLMEL